MGEMKRKILLVYAHPDDESFSIGGTLPLLKKKGVEIKLLCATRGEAGKPGDPPFCRPWELGEVRTAELKCAAKILGIKEIFFLGLRDGMLAQSSLRFLSDLISPILQYESPDVVITFAPNGISGHDDHVMISRATHQAFRRYMKEINHPVKFYNSTLPQSLVENLKAKGLMRQNFKRPVGGTSDDQITLVVDIQKTLPVKIKALQCHKTQHKDWERFLKRRELGFTNHEYFVLRETTIKKPKQKEADFFEGL